MLSIVLGYAVIVMKVISLTEEDNVVYNYCSKYASIKKVSTLESFVLTE